MKIGSLCTGYGGLDMATAAAFGARTVWHVEHDKHPSAILAHRYPTIPNYGDVKTTDWSSVEPVQILTAGYPCQPFSDAGKRLGTDDPRHLFPYVADCIGALRPGVVILENVRGHLRRGFDVVLGTLADLGYDARWTVVRASDAGAPHRRERIFIVATDAGGERRIGRKGSVGDGRHETVGSEASDHPVYGGIASTLDHLPATDARGERHALDRGVTPTQDADIELGIAAPGQEEGGRPRPDAGRRGGASAADAESNGRHEGRTESARLVGRPDAALAVRTTAADADGPRSQGGEPAAGRYVPAWGAYESAIRRWEAVLGRAAPCPTEAGRNGERLSPAFVEWMMGLPAGWVTDVDIPRNAQLKALGNGVVPQQAALALRLLLPAITQERAA